MNEWMNEWMRVGWWLISLYIVVSLHLIYILHDYSFSCSPPPTCKNCSSFWSFRCRFFSISNACDWLRQKMADAVRNFSPASPLNCNVIQLLASTTHSMIGRESLARDKLSLRIHLEDYHYTVFCPGFQKGTVPSEKGTFSAANGPSKRHN